MTSTSEGNSSVSRFSEPLAAVLLLAALLSIQALIGGTRLIFSIPAFSAIAGVGLLAVFSIRAIKPAPDQIALVSALIFLAYIELRAVFSPVPYLARSDIYSVVAGLVIYHFTSCLFTSPRRRMWVVAALLTGGIAHVLVAAIQFRNGDNFMLIPALQRFDYGSRGSGFYVCPNHLAGLLEVIGVFGISIVCWSRWPTWGKLLVGYASVVCYAGIILTGSRGGYLSVTASLLLFGILSIGILKSAGSSALWKIGGAGMGVVAVGLMAAVLFVGQSKDLTARATNVIDTQNMRLDLWQAALKQWHLAPILGTGSGTYVIYGRMFRTDRMQLDPIYAHNDYVHLLAEYGAVGAALLLSFLIAHGRSGLINFSRLGPKRIAASGQIPSNALALNIGALCAVAAYAVHSVFDFNLHIPANLLLMAFVFGILANSGVQRDRRKNAALRARWWRVVPALLGILLAWECIRLAPGAYFAERARVALRDFRPIEAISYGLAGIATEREDPQLFYTLGRARILLGESMIDERARDSFYRAALEDFLTARSLARTDETFTIESGLTFDALRRFEEAEWMFYEARQLDPKSVATQAYYKAHLDRWFSGGGAVPDPAAE